MSDTTILPAECSGQAARTRALRAGLALAITASLTAFAVRLGAQQPAALTKVSPSMVQAVATAAPSVPTATAAAVPAAARSATRTPALPFAIGEDLVFHVTFGKLPAGKAEMRVVGIDTVRGRPAYHVSYNLDGGILLYRVHDRLDSWIDVETLSSLRHTESISEGPYHRQTKYELYTERGEYQKNNEVPQPSVPNPLDDGSFLYAIRIAGVQVGDTVRNERYFKADKNPVVLIGLKHDTVSVGAGRFATTLVHPTIKTTGIFSEDGDARVWFSNDARRLPVQVKAKFAKFSLSLTLQSATLGDTAAAPRKP